MSFSFDSVSTVLHSGSLSSAVDVLKETMDGGAGDTIQTIEDSVLNEVISAMVANMKDLEAEIGNLKERNEILRNYVTSLEETNERAQGEIWDLKELIAERRDLADLCKMIGRYKDNSEDEIEGTNIDNRKPNEELNEKKI